MPTQLEDEMKQSCQDYDGCADNWQQVASRGADQLRDMVRDNTGSSMMLAFATGLGVGFVIGAALGKSCSSSNWRDRSTAEGVGRRLLERIEKLVPDAISDRLNA